MQFYTLFFNSIAAFLQSKNDISCRSVCFVQMIWQVFQQLSWYIHFFKAFSLSSFIYCWKKDIEVMRFDLCVIGNIERKERESDRRKEKNGVGE